jgi:phage terminase small subunit
MLMTARKAPGENSNRIKSPDDWVTGNEEMTGAQQSYLETLASDAHERVAPDLTKADASKEIDRLKAKTGRRRRTPAKPQQKASRRAS